MTEATRALLIFLGQVALAFGQFIRGRARLAHRRSVAHHPTLRPARAAHRHLISFLVGLILAFVGAVQLRQFGAQIYVADLVGIAMATEMGAMMTAIIMAGRTGAAFAAQLGTMQVNEEIDALTTMGISPMEFLVLPRMLALVLMVPLLTLYADLLGILGGTLVGATMLNLTPTQYINETIAALTVTDFVKGLVKGTVFGVLVAIAGCLRGMQCGRSSAAVGTGRHLRRGHRHRVHHRVRRDPDRHLQCPRRLARAGRRRRRDHAAHHGERSDDGLWQLRHPARPRPSR